jgi:hypothetical protein
LDDPENYQITKAEYLNLWMYFHECVQQLKHSLTQLLIWLMAIAAAMIGFLVKQQNSFDKEKALSHVSDPASSLLIVVLGIGITFFALYLILDYAKNINLHWHSAELIKSKVIPLDIIYPSFSKANQILKKMSMPPLCRDLMWIVLTHLYHCRV